MSAGMHWRTPLLSVSDGRGLPIRQIEYLRARADDTAIALITRQQHDVAGRRVTQRDPRLSDPNVTTIYDLNGAVLKSDSVDAGWRLNLPGLADEPLQRWDQRGSHWRTRFDNQLRVVALEENGQADVDVFIYADASADAGHNLRGQLIEQKDLSGGLRLSSHALLGQPLAETRTFHDGAAFSSRRIFNALGATLEQTDAGGHRQQSHYGLTGQLRQANLLIKGAEEWQTLLFDVQYNAAGQIVEQRAGNEVRSRWTYDPANGRLHTQTCQKGTAPPLQSFEYFYDRVGNITRIEDHAFQPVYFANHLIDGHRNFTYDSLYRLISASGYDDEPLTDVPGLPQPTDPKNRLNYSQTYTYDSGGNLTELRHVRAGANYTRQMRIDQQSNRGVRWQPGDPEPDFDKLFDRHGNLLALQPGQPLQWNVRDELQSVILIPRDGTGDDAEHYRYSQGVRVFKRHETFTGSAEHFHQVRYLPGVEIRTKDSGEELHVISLGNVRCLHWAKKPPPGIANNQLRYSLEDHLGSCVLELDQQAQIISHEGYYPFGATAWMAARSVIEVSYKFIRYSGKEMDVSGLYHYGARYYAPWLQHWISPDPAGSVDGLNLFVMVKNNPITKVDNDGQAAFDINTLNDIVRDVADTASAVNEQVTAFDGPDESDISQATRDSMTFSGFLFSKRSITAFGMGLSLGTAVGAGIGSLVPVIGNAIGGLVGGLLGGAIAIAIRYRNFKKNIHLAQTLQTQEITDVAQNIAGGTQDLANGQIPQVAQDQLSQQFADDDSEIVEKVKQMNLGERSAFRNLLKNGLSLSEAYTALTDQQSKAREAATGQVTAVNETLAAQAGDLIQPGTAQQPARPVAAPRTARKPIPAPRRLQIGSRRGTNRGTLSVTGEESSA